MTTLAWQKGKGTRIKPPTALHSVFVRMFSEAKEEQSRATCDGRVCDVTVETVRR
jgi:hypothetical protein